MMDDLLQFYYLTGYKEYILLQKVFFLNFSLKFIKIFSGYNRCIFYRDYSKKVTYNSCTCDKNSTFFIKSIL